jgi:transketolase
MIIASGRVVEEALAAARSLRSGGVDVGVANMHTLKPLDEEFVRRCARGVPLIVTVENHSVIGGLGSAVAEVLADEGIGTRLLRIGVRDRFAEGASMAWLLDRHGLSAPRLHQAIGSALIEGRRA